MFWMPQSSASPKLRREQNRLTHQFESCQAANRPTTTVVAGSAYSIDSPLPLIDRNAVSIYSNRRTEKTIRTILGQRVVRRQLFAPSNWPAPHIPAATCAAFESAF